jgi:glutamine synthetase
MGKYEIICLLVKNIKFSLELLIKNEGYVIYSFTERQRGELMDSGLRKGSLLLGVNTFSFSMMKQRLAREFYDKLMFALRHRRPISPETADVIAQAMKEWAIAKGATHYTHWFQPLTGLTAEKHDSFLDLDENGQPIAHFAGKQLIVSEPDASSFPHGGLRSTFEARGYATWDPTSPAFLIERGGGATLCLPSIFVSYKGEVLDQKTPLLRSVEAVSRAAVRMLRLLGNKRVTQVMPNVGAEQEFFLIKEELAARRPDILEVGSTVLGADPPRGQRLEDHYFRAINERVLAFMEEAEQELIRLGVPVKTRHNEVAPAQFELAFLHQPVNIACDQNQLVMEVLRRVARHHGLVALLHEKPFAWVNGSGKHNNWSLIDSEGTNLLEPGSSSSARLRFLVFLMATVWGVHRHGSLLSAITAGAGNELRLGGHEAPPQITSVHLGRYLSTLLENVASKSTETQDDPEDIDLGLGGVARLPRDTTDRNRTSPFAFTGNKFEFRAVGAAQAISLPNVVINAVVAQSLDLMADRMEQCMKQGKSKKSAIVKVLRQVIRESEACRYDGDSYTTEWVKEAVHRGLRIPKHTPDALDALVSSSTVSLFEQYCILTREEIEARYRINCDLYAKTILVELRVALQMLATQVLPASLKYQKKIAEAVNETRHALLGVEPAGLKHQERHLARMVELNGRLIESIGLLERDDQPADEEGLVRAIRCAEEIRPHIAKARNIADQLEELVDAADWPLPRYAKMLCVD